MKTAKEIVALLKTRIEEKKRIHAGIDDGKADGAAARRHYAAQVNALESVLQEILTR